MNYDSHEVSLLSSTLPDLHLPVTPPALAPSPTVLSAPYPYVLVLWPCCLVHGCLSPILLPSFMNFATFMPGNMSAPTGVPSSQQAAVSSKARDNMLCRRCRHDKQKCFPQERDWAAGEKCKRCSDRGYECSASEKAPYKPRKRRTMSGTPCSHMASRAALPQDGNVGVQSFVTTGSDPSPTRSASRPFLAWEADVEPVSLDSVAASMSRPDSESTTATARRTGEQDARTILARLDDLYATRQLLAADVKLCDQVEGWLGPSSRTDKVREAIKAVIVAIEAEFWSCSHDAGPFTKGKDIGPFKEAFLAKLRFIKYRFRNPPRTEPFEQESMHDAMEDVDDDYMLERPYELDKRKRIWSAAEYLIGNPCVRRSSRHPIHTHSESEIVSCFLKASEGIKDVCSEIVLDDADHRQTLQIGFGQAGGIVSPFPPCHLAVAEASSQVLLSLWKKSPMSPWEVDYLGRTPVHCAAYAGKTQGLQGIFAQCPMGVTNTGCDAFGLTPLQIAACKDDLQTFVRLSNAEAYVSSFTPEIRDQDGVAMSIMALAARNGSIKVAQYIIRHPLASIFRQGAFMQPGSSELCQALLNDQIELANILIDGHSEAYNLTSQIPAAKTLAAQKGLEDIVSRLEGLVSTRQDALGSLNDMSWERLVNYDASADSSSHFDSSQTSTLFSFDDPTFWNHMDSTLHQ